MKYLGVDYGINKTGLAESDGYLSHLLPTIKTKTLFIFLSQYKSSNSQLKIIIGNCPEDILRRIKEMGVEWVQVDETLTTKDAIKNLIHTSQSKRKKIEDSVAASLILESYLDSLKSKL